MQMPARAPAMTAMTATTLDQLSGGRFLLGLGASGPQVVEGWHGVAYGKPLERTREYIEIVRQTPPRDGRVDGTHYHVPYTGGDATGLGKPLKSILHAHRQMPIYVARSARERGGSDEIADGWLPIFFSPYASARSTGRRSRTLRGLADRAALPRAHGRRRPGLPGT